MPTSQRASETDVRRRRTPPDSRKRESIHRPSEIRRWTSLKVAVDIAQSHQQPATVML
jgi:hypothetical protein